MKTLALVTLICLSGLASLAQTQTTVLEYTNQWRYLQGTNTPDNWFGIHFDDSAWPQGRGVFAVPTNENVLGVAPVNTALSTNAMGGYIITYYFRTLLNLESNLSDVIINGTAVIDDGAVIYVNGREARRIAMPSGSIGYGTFATRSDDVSAHGVDTFTLASSNFVPGINVIAVEVHQPGLNNSDAVFGMRLTAQQLDPVVITRQPADQTVEEGRSATFTVEATGSSPQYRWFRNGALLPASTNSFYTTPADLAQNGTVYHVVITNALNSVTSAPAVLMVFRDVRGPLARFAFLDSSNRVEIWFDEALLRNSATNSTNYSIYLLGTTNRIRVTNALSAITRVRAIADQNLYPSNDYVVCFTDLADTRTNIISPNPTCVAVGVRTTNTLVSMGQAWRYNDNEFSVLPEAWKTLNYNDDPFSPPYHWAEGPGAFGFSRTAGYNPCSPLRTPLSAGPITYYFRRRFVLSTYPADAVARLRYLVDDGAVFYVNGTEIFRTPNMPQGPIQYSTLAARVADAACTSNALSVLPPFVVGTNIFTAEVHQATESAPQFADVVFDAELSVEYMNRPSIPALRIALNQTGAVLTWEGSGWALERAESIRGPWTLLGTMNNRYETSLGETNQYFRLVIP